MAIKKAREKKSLLDHDADMMEKYQKLFGSSLGKEVLCDLMGALYYTKRTGEGEKGLKNEGKREGLIYILDILGADPNSLRTMNLENNEKKEIEYDFGHQFKPNT